MANPRWSSHTNGYEAAVWAAKIIFCFLVVLSLGAASRAAVPVAAGAVAFALPGFSASLCSWFAPPYLFVAVNFIVLVLWKLSEEKEEHGGLHSREQWEAEGREAETRDSAKIKFLEPSHSSDLLRKPSLEIWPSEISLTPLREAILSPDSRDPSTPDSSYLTTESDEKRTAPTAYAVKKGVEPESRSSIVVAEAEDLVEVATAVMENVSMDLEATWKAIMEKSSRAATVALPPSAAASMHDERKPEAPPPSVAEGHDELNRRFDDFIKKNREQIRLQNSQRR